VKDYVHGYSKKEAIRLEDQANSLEELIHHDTAWDEGTTILEAGCGVGAHTKIIAKKNPDSNFISIDISKNSVDQAKKLISSLNISNVKFEQADIFNLPYQDNFFDAVFICHVLEHLTDPIDALLKLKRVLKPNGSIMVIEGDHGSAYFYPESIEAMKAIQCQVELQKQKGGDANIGRKLFPVLKAGGFQNIKISPRMVYVDDSHPGLVEGFTKNTFTAMIEGISREAVEKKLSSAKEMAKGIEDLYATASGNGTFCYTFFKGIATNPS
jgi:ubiquinone/menaquinone biosynthesis C-methylase UbiE